MSRILANHCASFLSEIVTLGMLYLPDQKAVKKHSIAKACSAILPLVMLHV